MLPENAPLNSYRIPDGTRRLLPTLMAREQQSISETVMPDPLSPDLLRKMHAYWRAANYLSVGQIYLQDNPLLETALKLEHIKPRLLGHWGTTTGLNFLYVHLNRLIKDNDLNMIYVIGPGHGGPGIVAHSYLEGSYTERYPAIERSRNGLQRLFRQFSWPYGIPSHVSPETPGSIHEGGELGYSLAHAYGAAFDNPDLIVSCIIGDGEAETGALATSWHSNKFLNPARDGAVLPILHLNGFKIAGRLVDELPATGIVRRARQIPRGVCRAGADRSAPYGLQSARQRR
jgi:xylulose-5-phosphate/fructose-6-phosphate phosphoketolase